MAGCVEGIRRALILGLVLIVGTAIEQAPSVGPGTGCPVTSKYGRTPTMNGRCTQCAMYFILM